MEVTSIEGRRLVFERGQQSSDDVWSLVAELQLPEDSVRTEVWDAGSGLIAFLRGMADDWKGGARCADLC